MISTLLRRLFSKLGLLSLLIAYLAIGELYMGGLSLWQSLNFFLNSSPNHAQLVDVRRRETEDWYQLLPSGALSFQGDMLYYPIVAYTSPNFMVPLRVELPAPSTSDYERGAMLEIRTLDDNHLIAQESHGFFLWGGSLIRIALGLVMSYFSLALFRRAKARPMRRSFVPPAPRSDAQPVHLAPKQPRQAKTTKSRKKSAAPKKEAAPKKRSTRSKKDA
ncbi:MAG: hypothetical protein R3Y56_01020 [Akkermansia sp.]